MDFISTLFFVLLLASDFFKLLIVLPLSVTCCCTRVRVLSRLRSPQLTAFDMKQSQTFLLDRCFLACFFWFPLQTHSCISSAGRYLSDVSFTCNTHFLCALFRGRLDWVLGKILSPKGLSGTGTGSPGKSPSPEVFKRRVDVALRDMV